MIDLTPVLDFAGKLTVVGLLTLDLFVVVVGLQRKWWVPGWMYDEKIASEKAWKDVAVRNAGVAARSVDTAAAVLPMVAPREGHP